MAVDAKLQGNELTLSLSGKFDITLYEPFNEAYTQYLDKIDKVIVDMSAVEYIDSSALGMMLLLRERMGNTPERVVIRHVSDEVMKILRIANFETLFTIE